MDWSRKLLRAPSKLTRFVIICPESSTKIVRLQFTRNLKEILNAAALMTSHSRFFLQVLNLGWMNRTVAETSMNRESSRSHAVFTLTLQSKVCLLSPIITSYSTEHALTIFLFSYQVLTNGLWKVKSSQLNLVDLAGSERQKDTHTNGVRLIVRVHFQ